jgi:hypothetical protein
MGSAMTRVLAGLTGPYLVFAVIGRFVEELSAVECG